MATAASHRDDRIRLGVDQSRCRSDAVCAALRPLLFDSHRFTIASMSSPQRVYFVIAPLCLERQVLPPRHPPLFAAYALANLKRAGHQVLVRDLYHRVIPLSQVIDEAAAFAPDLVVIAPEDLDRKAPI